MAIALTSGKPSPPAPLPLRERVPCLFANPASGPQLVLARSRGRCRGRLPSPTAKRGRLGEGEGEG